MTHYYLAAWAGTGTASDPFRPDLADATGWSVVDLRPDATVVAGWCLLSCKTRPTSDPQSATYLGQGSAGDLVLTTTLRSKISSTLGVALTSLTLSGVLRELLVSNTTIDNDPTKWRRVKPYRGPLGLYRWEIRLGDVSWAGSTVSPDVVPL